MDSKFATIMKYKLVNIFKWDDDKMLDVVRSIVDVEVPQADHKNDVHPTDNFGLEEWAMYHTLCDACICRTWDGSDLDTIEEIQDIYNNYYDMGIDELSGGLGW